MLTFSSRSENEASGVRHRGKTLVDFWNGNRSEARQQYERLVLEAVLEATGAAFGDWEIQESLEDYPGDTESQALSGKGHDLLVTIAGNQKFADDDMIVVPHPLTKNLLGYRILIIREEDAEAFGAIRDVAGLQQKVHGIPMTWSDAGIFRENGFEVAEEGDFDDIFDRLAEGRFDYSAFGANEVLGVYANRALLREGLIMEENLLLFYPFPLVFYVRRDKPELAGRIHTGMDAIVASGRLDELFNEYYGNIVEELNLPNRTLIVLDNPLIPEEYRHLVPNIENLNP